MPIENYPHAVIGHGNQDIRCGLTYKRPGIYDACLKIIELRPGESPLINDHTAQGCADCVRDICYRQEQLPATS
ncbi:MAG: hypothetical protein WC596_00395 [Candidatus Shapirobacteria bacterium]